MFPCIHVSPTLCIFSALQGEDSFQQDRIPSFATFRIKYVSGSPLDDFQGLPLFFSSFSPPIWTTPLLRPLLLRFVYSLLPHPPRRPRRLIFIPPGKSENSLFSSSSSRSLPLFEHRNAHILFQLRPVSDWGMKRRLIHGFLSL